MSPWRVALILIGGCMALPAAVAVVRSAAHDAPPRIPPLITALEEDVRGSDPRRERDGLADAVHLHVVEGLVGLQDDLEVGLMLAQRLDVQDGGSTYRFTLRDDVRFHNGAPLTSAEVKWSWEYLMSADSLWRCRPVFAGDTGSVRVTAVEAPDARTVVFKLERPSGSFLQDMARLDCAQTPVLHPASLNGDGSWHQPVGTGPFMIGHRRRGEFVDVWRFADYASRAEPASGMVGRKSALVDGVRFMIVGDPSTRLLGMQAGDIDVTTIPPQLVKAAQDNPRLDVMSFQTTVWQTLLLNSRDPLLADRRMRQAISAALDRDAIASGATYGQATGNNSPLLPTSSYYEPSRSGTHANLETARRLLKEAGYAGQPIAILTNKRFAVMFDSAVLAQDLLRAAGINAHIEVVEWSLQFDRHVRGDYQIESMAFSGRFSPASMWERIIGPEPRKPWQDPAIIERLRRVERTADAAGLRADLQAIHEQFEADAPAVGLFRVTVNVAMNERVKGIEASPFEAVRLWNVALDRSKVATR